jgi:hypothetical protein
MSYIDSMRKGAIQPDSLEGRLEKRIARKRGDVFLRADFDDLGGYDQVGRALRGLVRKGRLMKIGQGLYARARRSSLDNKLMPEKGLVTLKERCDGSASKRCRHVLNAPTMPDGVSKCRPAAWLRSGSGGFAARLAMTAFS